MAPRSSDDSGAVATGRSGIVSSALLCAAFLLVAPYFVVEAFTLPASNCYSLSKDNHLYDFTSWVGKDFSYDQEGSTYTIRFCKDFQKRSSDSAYINYGRYSAFLPSTSSGVDFVQEYRYGDLKGCETEGFDMSGRSAEVAIICGSCPGSISCRDEYGCICSVSLDSSSCMISAVIAVTCVKSGPRVFSGFTVGFSPRGKEVVENGITQWGFDAFRSDYSFGTEQLRTYLYLTARSEVASNVGKPTYSVSPEKGLDVQLSGSATAGTAPTTESPSVLEVQWQCSTAQAGPYVVNVSIPVKDYDPVVFSLGKGCRYKQVTEKSGSSGWTTVGVLSFFFFLVTLAGCCGGFCYKTRVENKHGLDALPGIQTLASCLDLVSRDPSGAGYARAEDATALTRERPSSSSSSGNGRTIPRTSDSTYGSV